MTHNGEIPFIKRALAQYLNCTVSQDIAENPESNDHQNGHQTQYHTGVSLKRNEASGDEPVPA
jgi:hypothetical protein